MKHPSTLFGASTSCASQDWAAGFPSAFTNKLDDQPDFWNVVYTPISWQLNDGKQT
jgi:hypothetical protein